MKIKLFDIYLAVLLLFGLPLQSYEQTADIILTNGKVFTSDTNKLYVQALAIRGNKIIAAGTNAAIEKLAGKGTQKINLQG